MGLKLYFIVGAVFLYLSSYSSDTLVYAPVYKDVLKFVNSVEDEYLQEKIGMSNAELEAWWREMLQYEDDNLLSKKYKQINKQTALNRSLSFKTYYNENFETGIGDDEDITYKRRMFAGLEMELFKDGLFSGSVTRSNNKNKEIIEKIKYKKNTLAYRYVICSDYIEKYFNTIIKDRLLLKLKMERKLYKVYKLLSYDFKISRTSVLEKKASLDEVTKRINSLGELGSFSVPKNMPYLNLSVESLLGYKTNKEEKQLLKSKLSLLKNKNKMIAQWSLRPNVRYNFLDRDGSGDSKYGSAGFFLSVPFSSLARKKKLEDVEVKLLKEESNRNIESGNIEFVNIVKRSFKYEEELDIKLNNLSIARRKLESLNNRRIIYPDSFNSIEYLELLSDMVDIEIQILELNKKNYLNMLKISRDVNGISPYKFSKISSKDNMLKCFTGQRYIYVWSDLIDRIPAKLLLAYLKEYEIYSLMISLGSNSIEKYNKYVDVLSRGGINVYALLGSNRILRSDDKEINKQLNLLTSLNVKGVNLDIEPHTLSDWDSKKPFYYARMLKIYQLARTKSKEKNMELHASIPVHYDKDFLLKLNSSVDKIFLMAYKTTNADNIARKVSQEIEVFGKEKVVIAYRPKDFKSALNREDLIENVIEITGCKGVAFHKASELFKIETEKN